MHMYMYMYSPIIVYMIMNVFPAPSAASSVFAVSDYAYMWLREEEMTTFNICDNHIYYRDIDKSVLRWNKNIK